MMTETLKTLCALSGVSSFEDEVREYILSRALPHAAQVLTDPMGNLMILKKGATTTDRRVMLCAHMDEVGLIITGYADDGLLRFAAVGSVDKRVLLGKRVWIGEKRVPGVISLKAFHLTSAEERKTSPKVSDMYIDIGLTDSVKARELVCLGDAAVFDPQIVEFGDGWLMAKAIDDRVGCAVLLELLESELPIDTWFAFTVQEEVGCRGANAAAFRLEPDVALIVEGTTAADLPSVEESKHICRAGGGVVIPFMDGSTIYDREYRALLEKAADENGIVRQTKQVIAGGTDASAIQRSRAGVHAVGIAAAIRNIHSPSCVMKLSEADDLKALALAFLCSLK